MSDVARFICGQVLNLKRLHSFFVAEDREFLPGNCGFLDHGDRPLFVNCKREKRDKGKEEHEAVTSERP